MHPGGKVDWGHLGADVKRYGDPNRSYDMVGDEINALPAPPPPPPGAARWAGLPDGVHNGTAAAASAGANAPRSARCLDVCSALPEIPKFSLAFMAPSIAGMFVI